MGKFADELPSHLALPAHQIAAIGNPAIPLRELASAEFYRLDTLGRPIRLWGERPELAAELNERLFRAAEEAAIN
ncbi:hypothetical protein G7078_09335 [Sphingomonas sinipercae]|uniref:Uncharacterized protein n=1 Tax=Sphingomonas sinipercae TaxID=2714944 RepID=A0A6G7ZPU6_9SPHN|nr:hypothetical protein [Sphingomonas sinipercae]QIL02963.1 hypothetical protein G7078_09335 [Sphingomonas sinipercae]